MFHADPRTLQRIAPHLQRVLLIEPHAGWARLIGELLKGMGTTDLVYGHPDLLAPQIGHLRPQLIITELTGADYDGLHFVRRLRRGSPSARVTPVIMVTGNATRSAILGARNAGVHEFLRKPFTAGDLFRRIENVLLKPRDWIETEGYVGPDRRRFNSGEAPARLRRSGDRLLLVG